MVKRPPPLSKTAIILIIKLNSIFETYENRINDYEFFNVTNINMDKLISDELVAVHKIIFRVVDDALLDEQLQQDFVI